VVGESKLMPVVSLREYARHRQISHTAVQKAIRQGRIRTTPEGQIDVEQADSDWDRNSSPSAKPAKTVPQEQMRTEPPRGPSYAQSRAVRELYMARLAKLEYEERSGKLVSAEEVVEAAFNRGRVTRDRMLTIPDRISCLLAAESDERKIYDMLTAEIRDALIELTTPERYEVLERRLGMNDNGSSSES